MFFRTLIASLAVCAIGSMADAQGREDIYYIQIKLDTLGYSIGSHDGILGPKTRSALANHAKEMGFEPTPAAMMDFYQNRYWFETEPVKEGPLYQELMDSFEDVLLDPYSARFKDIVVQPSGNICGMVNAKNRMGAYTGYRHFMSLSTSMTIGSETIYLVMPPQIEEANSNKQTYFCWLDVNFKE